jgi:hypothetical protein
VKVGDNHPHRSLPSCANICLALPRILKYLQTLIQTQSPHLDHHGHPFSQLTWPALTTCQDQAHPIHQTRDSSHGAHKALAMIEAL